MKTINSITKLVAIVVSFAVISCSQEDAPAPVITPPPATKTLAVVATNEITNATKSTASVGAKISDDGGADITERGICFATTHLPTTANKVVADGTGKGDFTASLTGLNLNTTYYVRAYAINSVGTSYGNEVALTIGGADLYLAGGIDNDAGYWKNGTYTALTSDNKGAFATSIYVSGNDVYATGYMLGHILAYWKNGVATKITDGTNGDVTAADIFVSGSDVYVGGSEVKDKVLYPRVWKNGNEMQLQATGNASVTAMFISGADVYASGYEEINGINVAKYWKNGVGVNLTDGTSHAYGATMFVKGNDVYVAGYERTSTTIVAKYWKNGEPFSLSSGVNNYTVNDIFINDDDVYAVGFYFNPPYSMTDAIMWKNSAETNITNNSNGGYGQARKIWVSGNDVYVLGDNADAVSANRLIWKNGELLAPYDGAFSIKNLVSDMFIVDK